MFNDYVPLEKAQFSEGIPGSHIDWSLQGQLKPIDKCMFSVRLKKHPNIMTLISQRKTRRVTCTFFTKCNRYTWLAWHFDFKKHQLILPFYLCISFFNSFFGGFFIPYFTKYLFVIIINYFYCILQIMLISFYWFIWQIMCFLFYFENYFIFNYYKF